MQLGHGAGAKHEVREESGKILHLGEVLADQYPCHFFYHNCDQHPGPPVHPSASAAGKGEADDRPRTPRFTFGGKLKGKH